MLCGDMAMLFYFWEEEELLLNNLRNIGDDWCPLKEKGLFVF